MGQQPGHTINTNGTPISFNADRMNQSMNKFATDYNTRATARHTGWLGGVGARPQLGFADFMNYYMAGSDGPPAPPPVPTAFQQFRQNRAAGIGPASRTMQYTPPTGPRMARDNRVAGDMQA